MSNSIKFGRIANNFILDTTSEVCLIRGAFASTKSTACITKIFYLTSLMQPVLWKGESIHLARCCVCRETYPQLLLTTIKTFEKYTNDYTGRFILKRGSTIEGTLEAYNPTTDKRILVELVFMNVASTGKDVNIEQFKSLDLSFAWINEGAEVQIEVATTIKNRCNRFPEKFFGGQLIIDTNPPDPTSWWKEYELNPPRGWTFYVQPPALLRVNHETEYMDRDGNYYIYNEKNEGFLPKEYWLNAVSGLSSNAAKVLLLNEFGYLKVEGLMYPEYLDNIHCVIDLQYIKELPLLFGFDFGLTPACVIAQKNAYGGLNILMDIATLGVSRKGLEQFLNEDVLPVLHRNFKKGMWLAYIDPSGFNRAQTNMTTCRDILFSKGFQVMPALTQDPEMRYDSVANLLKNNNMFYMDGDGCQNLRTAFLSRYTLGEKKGEYSHVMEALQYLALGYDMNTQTIQKRLF